jgi:hypothetical protein
MIRFVITFAALGAATAALAADAPPPCTVAVKGDSPVAKACKEGGIPQAKRTMKELVRAAKAKGMNVDCTDCHKNTEDFKLNKDATEKFGKLLEKAK